MKKKSEYRGNPQRAWVKLNEAVEILATNPDKITRRLYSAYVGSLCQISPQDIPGDLRDDFLWIEDKLTRRDPKRQPWGYGRSRWGLVWEVLCGMHGTTGRKIAQRITALEWEMRKRYGPTRLQ